jgi:hypothetical protein
MEIPANPLIIPIVRLIEWVRIEIGKISNAVKVFIQKRRRTRNRDNTFVMNISPIFRVEMVDDSIEWVGNTKREYKRPSQKRIKKTSKTIWAKQLDEDKDTD